MGSLWWTYLRKKLCGSGTFAQVEGKAMFLVLEVIDL